MKHGACVLLPLPLAGEGRGEGGSVGVERRARCEQPLTPTLSPKGARESYQNRHVRNVRAGLFF